VFGIGPQELLLIGLSILVVFGPVKAAGMARDLGRFVSGANRTVEEFKEEILSEEEVKEARRTVEGFKEELRPPDENRTYSSPSASAPRSVVEVEGSVSQRDQKEDYKPR
jgi:Sec-independent protein translocase protein TatA